MDAVKYVVDHREDLRIDPEKIIAGGSSAGAEAVLNAVYNPGLMFNDPSTYGEIEFAGVLSLAGAVVDSRYMIEENAVPGVFFHGTKDNLVPYSTIPHHLCDKHQPGYLILDGSKTIADTLEKLGSSYMLVTFEGAGHEISGIPFENLDLIFRFFKDVMLEGQQQQAILTKQVLQR